MAGILHRLQSSGGPEASESPVPRRVVLLLVFAEGTVVLNDGRRMKTVRTKILFGVVTLAVFIGGALIRAHIQLGTQTDPSQAYATQGPAPTTREALQPVPAGYNAQPAPAQATAPAETGNYGEPGPLQAAVPAPEPAFQPQPTRHDRSLRRQALIVGGSAAAGTAVGVVAGGGKGAAVGAVSGGIAGLVYDLLTKNR